VNIVTVLSFLLNSEKFAGFLVKDIFEGNEPLLINKNDIFHLLDCKWPIHFGSVPVRLEHGLEVYGFGLFFKFLTYS